MVGRGWKPSSLFSSQAVGSWRWKIGYSGASSATVLMTSPQAAFVAYGDNETGTRYRWTEETKDHGNSVAIGTHSIMGVKKATYKSKDATVQRDFGVIAIDTANVDPNP